MVTVGKNFAGQETPSIVDTEYQNCNFSQPAPVPDGGDYIGVRLFPGDDTSRTFTDCNMTNCEPPPGSTQTRCNGTIRESAKHVDSEYVTVDSQAVELKLYMDIIYGRYQNGTYTYHPTPIEVPVEGPEG